MQRFLCVMVTLFLFGLSAWPADGVQWNFVCQPDNDLYQVMVRNQQTCHRFDSIDNVLPALESNSSLLILADAYPNEPVQLPEMFWQTVREKKLHIYVEYPKQIPGIHIGKVETTRWERGVVASSDFAPELPAMSILAIHDCHYLPVSVDSPLLAVAKVAGFDKAVYGLPKNSAPILFRLPNSSALIAATQLSRFVTARYSPYQSWQRIWQVILQDLSGESVPQLEWKQTVQPAYKADEKVPANEEELALKQGSDWFYDSRLLVDPDDEKAIQHFLDTGLVDQSNYAAGWSDSEARPLPSKVLIGDGSLGILEGYSSRVLVDGSQPQRVIRRSDCIAESAMGLAFGHSLQSQGRPSYFDISSNLLDFIYTTSSAQGGVRADPKNPAYGLIAWGVTNWAWERATYGDDMARVMLASIATTSLLKKDRWDEGILKCLLGSLRTTGRFGFRRNRIDIPDLESHGWRYFYDEGVISYAPHYQAYLWACYLWAFKHTGYSPFLEQAKTAIEMTMNAYPDHWHWTNGIQQERARMLLPLAWLVQIEDTPQHRAWLRKMADELLALQDKTGAIREAIGELGMGSMQPPQSNEAYGTGETPLLQKNGDPVCDMLYTTNFAFLGLHEAAAATGDSYYKEKEDKLADFLCRIQIKSKDHKELNGGWYRAFDFKSWEYWASNADAGWGVWCIESGWTQGWITGVLGMRHQRTSLWDLSEHSQIQTHFDSLFPLFFPDGDQRSASKQIKHAAYHKPVHLKNPYSPQYAATGPGGLTDGYLANDDYPDYAWQGFHGVDVDAVIDLEKDVKIQELSIRFLQKADVGIFLPKQISFALSEDGKSYSEIGVLRHSISTKEAGPLVHNFDLKNVGETARFIKITAKNLRIIPSWHHSAGKLAWLFTDEIVVNGTSSTQE